MPVQLRDYPDMVDRLGKGGFDADHSAALIQLLGRLFSDQNKHIDQVLDKQRDFIEQIRHENRSEHEKTRSEARAQFEKLRMEDRELETKFEVLDGKIERNWRWTIAMLTAISVSMISALTLLLMRSVE